MIQLTKEQLSALIAFADEGDRPNGCTAWGPQFDAVMLVCRTLRDMMKTENAKPQEKIADRRPECRARYMVSPARR